MANINMSIWTVDVIAHLIEATKTGKTIEKAKQLSLF